MRDLPFPSPVKVIFDVATGRFLDACTVVSPVLVHRHLSDQWKQHDQHESTLGKVTKQGKREPKQTIGRKWRSHRLPFPHAETTTTKCVPLIELDENDAGDDAASLGDGGMAAIRVETEESPDFVHDDGTILCSNLPLIDPQDDVKPPVLLSGEVLNCHRCGNRMISKVRKMKYRNTMRAYPTYRCTKKGCQTFMSPRTLDRKKEFDINVPQGEMSEAIDALPLHEIV